LHCERTPENLGLPTRIAGRDPSAIGETAFGASMLTERLIDDSHRMISANAIDPGEFELSSPKLLCLRKWRKIRQFRANE
jgi:hypothetical protein